MFLYNVIIPINTSLYYIDVHIICLIQSQKEIYYLIAEKLNDLMYFMYFILILMNTVQLK